MKGLVLKDLLLIKGNLRTLLIIFFGFMIMALNNIATVSFIIPFFAVMMCISTFNYDEYNKWNAYAITLPGGRKNIVKSKYISTILLVVLSSIISILVSIIIGNINGNINYEETFSTLFGGLFGIFLVMSIMYPLIYKYGNEKGRLFLFIGVFLITAVGGVIFNTVDTSGINKPAIIDFLDKFGLYLLPIVSLVILYISYSVSVRIYKNKDF